MVAVRIAKCENYIEHDDLTATPCDGVLVFRPAHDLQARCNTCGAWCGIDVADYIAARLV